MLNTVVLCDILSRNESFDTKVAADLDLSECDRSLSKQVSAGDAHLRELITQRLMPASVWKNTLRLVSSCAAASVSCLPAVAFSEFTSGLIEMAELAASVRPALKIFFVQNDAKQ